MASVEEKLNKLREERIAREKARIEKLRELNLKKYNKNEAYSINHSASNASVANKTISAKPTNSYPKNNIANSVKNNFHVNGTTKKPISVHINKSATYKVTRTYIKPGETSNSKPNSLKIDSNSKTIDKSTVRKQVHKFDKTIPKVTKKEEQKIDLYQNVNTNSRTGKTNNNEAKAIRKSFAPATSKSNLTCKSFSTLTKPNDNRKSMQPPKATQSAPKVLNPQRISVFERLYKPKIVNKVTVNEVPKLHTDPSYLRKIIKDSHFIMKQRHSLAHTKPLQKTAHPVRRSISAVHFKKVSKSELRNCIHKWASIGEKLDKVDMNEIDEDECVQCEKVVSAVKSERKRVKFQTPVSLNFNTPRPEEMQARLQKWLQKHGKSLDSYHHLQCFGIFHLSKDIKSLEAPKFESYDEENKENIAVESDSDNQSYTDNLNDHKDDFIGEKAEVSNNKWRRASYVCDSVSFNESKNTTLTSAEDLQHFDELLLGALNDLTELLREGFDWEQCARWLRAIRDRYPSAPESAAYWECRAALEERRGDLPASMQCLGEAIAMGTERSVVESSLDQLLDKFMQLKISPNTGRQKPVDPKMVDVKNVFKSTIIRFAVQQAKLRQSNHYEPPKYTVTPVRRSGRLSVYGSGKRTPLQVCSSISQATSLGHPVVFVPNDQLFETP
ncbi:unnamed protein product [Parnassius apollo]|uniref:(apollo) hypothetical protein n=1 Tax=Parnassius apollo TaxID=110799 RepID=A0A8S3W9N0_PARAO|nr:unnamed protein product [Parnassius apollo]